MDEDEFTTATGYSLTEVAREIRTVLLNIVGREVDEWDGLPEIVREHWKDCIEVLVDVCEREVEMSWADLTMKAHTAYHGKECYDNEPELMKLVWQALCRHAVNLITAEDRDDITSLADAAEFWKEWVLERSGRDVGNGNGNGRIESSGDEGEEIDGGV